MGQPIHRTYESSLGWAGHGPSSIAESVRAEAGWLRSKQFDTFFILGIAALAIVVKGGAKLDHRGGGKLDHPAVEWRG